ncbi:MAG: response regulator [Polyangiaceae bacterium]|nr:response regulator [Polyangiaceae bacterium]MCW5790888.1 response regulator [Polyangiaceae bacterium]
MSKKQIGRILLQQRALTPEELEKALAERGASGGRLASRLAEQGTIDDVAALKALSEQHGIPGIDLSQICLRLDDLELLPREIAEKHLILPVLVKDDRLFIAMANPAEKKVVDELEFVTGKKVYAYIALEGALSRVIEEAYSHKARGEDYYIGPRCPPEVLERLGLTPGVASQGDPFAEAPLSLSPGSSEPGRTEIAVGYASGPGAGWEAPGVVVDDAVGRASRADEVEDDDFGDVSKELSVVADLPDGGPPLAPGHKTVLVVDDEAEIRRMLARLLSSKGYRVVEVDRGLAALRMVKEHRPDLIILDAMLPEVHGFEIARRIKGSQRYGAIPIIMISAVYRGWRYAEDLRQSCGVEHYIEKPFKIADVTRAVESALQGATLEESKDSQAISEEAERELALGVAAYQAGRVDEAMAHLRQGISIDPLAYRLHFHLGLLYGKRGLVYEAISELETAVEINSRHFPAVKNLAILYQKAGFRNKATETWQRALNLAPDEATRTSIKEHLVSLL